MLLFFYFLFAGKLRIFFILEWFWLLWYYGWKFNFNLRIPVAIVLLIDENDTLPNTAHTFTNLPAHLNSALNPIFYGLFNPTMRNGYNKILKMLLNNQSFIKFSWLTKSKKNTKSEYYSKDRLNKKEISFIHVKYWYGLDINVIG